MIEFLSFEKMNQIIVIQDWILFVHPNIGVNYIIHNYILVNSYSGLVIAPLIQRQNFQKSWVTLHKCSNL